MGLHPSNLDAALYFVRGRTRDAEYQRFNLAVCGCELSPLRLTKLAGKQGDGRRRRVSLGINGERLEMVLISRPKSGLSTRELRVSVVPPSKAPNDPTIST